VLAEDYLQYDLAPRSRPDVSKTSMKVANITAMAINQGFTAGLPTGGVAEETDAPVIPRSERSKLLWERVQYQVASAILDLK